MMRTLRSSKRPRLAVFASVIVFAGCGLFVGDRKQAVCDFAGRAGACGECLSSACVDATFACCGGSDCRSALETVPSCAADGTCSAAFEATGATVLATCVREKCAPACGGATGGGPGDPTPDVSTTDGASANDASSSAAAPKDGGSDSTANVDGSAGAKNKTTCEQLGTGCTCDLPDTSHPANSFTCDKSIGQAAVCCADRSWPSSGSCSCLTADCDHPAGGGCSCSLGTRGDSCTDGIVCCVSPYNECLCTWGVTECWRGYKQVAQCDGAAIGCGNFYKAVSSCSVPN